MNKVKFEVMKPWITREMSHQTRPAQPPPPTQRGACAERVTELLGFEDEVVIEYVFGQLEAGRVSRPRSTWTSLGCPTSARRHPVPLRAVP